MFAFVLESPSGALIPPFPSSDTPACPPPRFSPLSPSPASTCCLFLLPWPPALTPMGLDTWLPSTRGLLSLHIWPHLAELRERN